MFAFGKMLRCAQQDSPLLMLARKDAVLTTLAVLEQVLRRGGVPVTGGAGVGAAMDFYG